MRSHEKQCGISPDPVGVGLGEFLPGLGKQEPFCLGKQNEWTPSGVLGKRVYFLLTGASEAEASAGCCRCV